MLHKSIKVSTASWNIGAVLAFPTVEDFVGKYLNHIYSGTEEEQSEKLTEVYNTAHILNDAEKVYVKPEIIVTKKKTQK